MYSGQGGYPQGGYPQAGYPQGGYPQGGYPQGGYPQGGYPQGDFPQGGYPQGGYPQQGGYPPGGYPPAGYGPPSGPYGPGYSSVQDGGYQPTGVGADDDVKGFEFSDETIRKGFIRKVYSILMVQLLATMGVISLFLFHTPTKVWAQRNPFMFWVAFGVMIVTMIALACCQSVRRTFPMNFIMLGLFTAAESFLLGLVSSVYQANEVLMAIGITAAVCLALTLFAFQTKWDFTMMGGVLLCAVVVLFIFGIVAIFIPGNTVRLVYASLAALVFSMYLVYDTQLMMGGKHRYSISPEEYVFAALNLYLDIIQIFIQILTIIGIARSD